MCVYILDRERDDQKNKGEREKKKNIRERESALRGGAKERGWSDHAM